VKRTLILKLSYLISIVALITIIIALTYYLNLSRNLVILICLLGLIPGRIIEYFWRNLRFGQKLIQQKKYLDSITYSELFIEDCARNPWIVHLIWLSPSFYTIAPKAMALNNIAVAYIELGELDRAKSVCYQALEIDPFYGIPYYNLAAIFILQSDELTAQNHYARAKRLGFSGGAFDRFVQKTKSLYAHLSSNSS